MKVSCLQYTHPTRRRCSRSSSSSSSRTLFIKYIDAMLLIRRHLRRQTAFLRFLSPVSSSSLSSSSGPTSPSSSTSSSSPRVSPAALAAVAKWLDGQHDVPAPFTFKPPPQPTKAVARHTRGKRRYPVDIKEYLLKLTTKDPSKLDEVCEKIHDPSFCMNIPAKSFLDGSMLRLLHTLFHVQRPTTAMTLLVHTILVRDTYLVASILMERPRFQFEKLHKAGSKSDEDHILDDLMPADMLNQGLQPPEALIMKVYHQLLAKRGEHNSVDLMLALLSFGREENKSSKEYKLLEYSEGFFSILNPKEPKIKSCKDALTILEAYDIVGRRHDVILDIVDKVLCDSSAKDLPLDKFPQILRANARLCRVHRNSDNILKQRQLEYARYAIQDITHEDISFAELKKIGKIMWSLACMGLIHEVEKFSIGFDQPMTPLQLIQYSCGLWRNLDRYHRDTDGQVPSFIQQMYVAVAELMTSIKDDQMHQQLMDRYSVVNMARDYRSTTSRKKKGKMVSSSWFHQDASRTLKSYGIAHETEKPLEYGYMADIFLTPQQFPALLQLELSWDKGCYFTDIRPKSIAKGLVIEINGPSHYETYLGRELGHTIQKKRHLEALGYHVANISHRTYDHRKMTKEEKIKIILNSIFESDE